MGPIGIAAYLVSLPLVYPSPALPGQSFENPVCGQIPH